MDIKKFLKPNGAKILLFLFLLAFAPFPYFFQSETSENLEIKWIWGFPPFVSLIYNYLPESLKQLNIGVFDISKVRTTYYWTPTYALFIFILSCLVHTIIEKIKMKYGIITFRGILWKKLGRRPVKPVEKQEPEKVEKKEPKEEVIPEELDEDKIREMETLIKEEEAFLKEQKKDLEKYLDEMNIKKLKSMGVDMKENKIYCSNCKRWIKLPRDNLINLIKKHGLDIIWEYRCPDCKK